MKLKKVILILIIALISFNTICYATIDTNNYRPADLVDKDYKRAFEMTGSIINGIRAVGTVLSILAIMIIGIKYMIGSVEEKAEYKKTMIPYLVGCILLFSITQIVSIIYNLVLQMR